MPAPAKFTRRRERRLLTLIESGATVAEACRAVEVARNTIYKHARADVFFAERLRAAREQREPALDSIDALDWREAARRLEADDPLRWALPGDDGDPFDPLDDFDATA
jgi:hypothetical protein